MPLSVTARVCSCLLGVVSVAQSVAAAPDSATAPAATSTTARAQPEGFVPIAGLLIHPYATDEAFGAGFQVGVRREFVSLMFRENFLRSTQRVEDGELVRLKSRASFEASIEAQAQLGKFVLYAGPGALVRRDSWQRARLVGERFEARDSTEIAARPLLVAGLIGSVVEANLMLVLESEPELRCGLGFVVGR